MSFSHSSQLTIRNNRRLQKRNQDSYLKKKIISSKLDKTLQVNPEYQGSLIRENNDYYQKKYSKTKGNHFYQNLLSLLIYLTILYFSYWLSIH